MWLFLNKQLTEKNASHPLLRPFPCQLGFVNFKTSSTPTQNRKKKKKEKRANPPNRDVEANSSLEQSLEANNTGGPIFSKDMTKGPTLHFSRCWSSLVSLLDLQAPSKCPKPTWFPMLHQENTHRGVRPVGVVEAEGLWSFFWVLWVNNT